MKVLSVESALEIEVRLAPETHFQGHVHVQYLRMRDWIWIPRCRIAARRFGRGNRRLSWAMDRWIGGQAGRRMRSTDRAVWSRRISEPRGC